MRLQILDESVRFSCHSCTACCDQPWETLIEPDKARALDEHDFSVYPQLAGKTLHTAPADKNETRFQLAKGDGTRCAFLDTDGLCIIHKELGAAAKPDMCLQFPYLPARTWTEDRLSVNYGCPSVQQQKGVRLVEQLDEIKAIVPISNVPVKPDGPVPLDRTIHLTQSEANALFDRLATIFGSQRTGEVWSRFAEAVVLLITVHNSKAHAANESTELIDALRSNEPLPDTPATPSIEPSASPDVIAMPARFLFAATLFPDTLPADTAGNMGFFRRLTLIPKLMALSKLSGAYASRLLARNVAVRAVLDHPIDPTLPAGGTDLLLRYIRSRLWHRFPAGTRLPIIAGLHQHIHDFNAIIFYARAEAQHTGAAALTDDLIRQALTKVEFHLANQRRLYDHTLKNWLRTQLDNPALALESLRLMRFNQPQTVST